MSLLKWRELDLPGLIEIEPRRIRDERGFFSEVWSQASFEEAGVLTGFVQDNVSLSIAAGVLRGLHFQTAPAAQAKLVRVSRGSIFDVAVDIRRSSPSFGRWAGIVLSAEKWNQFFIPEGFAHGFVTLEHNSEVTYKVSAPYSPEHDRSIRWDDPAIGIEWPFESAPILSTKDRAAPLLAQTETGF